MSGIDLFYGPMLIGIMLNCVLMGILVMQVLIYFQSQKRDGTWLRCFVAYLFITELVNTGCDIGLIYQPLVLEFGEPAATTFFPIMLAASPIVTAVISTPVQFFMAWRIRIITGSKLIALIICFFSLCSAAGALWVGVEVVTFKLLSRKFGWDFIGPAVMWFVATAVADLMITITLSYGLHKRKGNHRTTNWMINRIIRLTVQTGLITTLFALLDMFFSVFYPQTAVNFVWDFPLSKLYSNALISTLNARVGWSNLSGINDSDNVLFGTTGGSANSQNRILGSNFRAQPLRSQASKNTVGSAHSGVPSESNSKLPKDFTESYELRGFGQDDHNFGPNNGDLVISVTKQTITDMPNHSQMGSAV